MPPGGPWRWWAQGLSLPHADARVAAGNLRMDGYTVRLIRFHRDEDFNETDFYDDP